MECSLTDWMDCSPYPGPYSDYPIPNIKGPELMQTGRHQFQARLNRSDVHRQLKYQDIDLSEFLNRRALNYMWQGTIFRNTWSHTLLEINTHLLTDNNLILDCTAITLSRIADLIAE